jgi:SAM-dependent methyltransferase
LTPVIDYNFVHYLTAKKTVDDRALNDHVRETLRRALPPPPLRVLEVGAGIGTTVERMLERQLLTDAAFTAVDAEPGCLAEARRRLPRWAAATGWEVSEAADGQIVLAHLDRRVTVDLVCADVFEFAGHPQNRHGWDLLVAHAFLDLLDVATALPLLFACLRPGGVFYFTHNFDGATILQPALDPALDAKIEGLYHRTMDERITAGKPSGDSRTGQRLFGHLRRAGAELLEAGSSDWVVFARAGGYPDDEAYFLHHIIHFIEGALRGHPELDSQTFATWIAERHAQIERGELVYVAHQLDFVGRVNARP